MLSTPKSDTSSLSPSTWSFRHLLGYIDIQWYTSPILDHKVIYIYNIQIFHCLYMLIQSKTSIFCCVWTIWTCLTKCPMAHLLAGVHAAKEVAKVIWHKRPGDDRGWCITCGWEILQTSGDQGSVAGTSGVWAGIFRPRLTRHPEATVVYSYGGYHPWWKWYEMITTFATPLVKCFFWICYNQFGIDNAWL